MALKDIAGHFGILPRLAMDAYDKEHNKAEAAKKESAMYKNAFMNTKNAYQQPQPLVTRKKGGMVGSASKRADGCAQRGKTKGKIV